MAHLVKALGHKLSSVNMSYTNTICLKTVLRKMTIQSASTHRCADGAGGGGGGGGGG